MSNPNLLWGSFKPFPRPITGYQGEEINTSFSTSPPQEAVRSNKVAPQPPFLQTRQTQSPQLLLTGHTFQLFHQVWCPPLDAFKHVNILLQLWGPELFTALKVRPHQCWIQWDNHLFWTAGYAVFDASQDLDCPLGCQGTLLSHMNPAVNQHSQTPFCRAGLQPLVSQFILVTGVTPPQVQNPAFGPVKGHATGDCLMLQSIQIPLQGLSSLERVNTTSQFSIISKLVNGAFSSCLQTIDKNIEQKWP